MARHNRRRNDIFQRVADALFDGRRGLTLGLFWLGLFTFPIIPILVLVFFGVLPVIKEQNGEAGHRERQSERPERPAYGRQAEFRSTQFRPKYAQPDPYSRTGSENAPHANTEPVRRTPPKPAAPAPEPVKPKGPSCPRPRHTGKEKADSLLEACYSFQCEAEKYLPEIDDMAVRTRAMNTCAKVQSIMDWVQVNPDSADKAGRLSSYYLPTTLKLLRTYIAVDNNPAPSAQAICRQIDSTLVTLNKALDNLQDNMLGSAAMDVEAEISAMEQMLSIEGLTENMNITLDGKQE